MAIKSNLTINEDAMAEEVQSSIDEIGTKIFDKSQSNLSAHNTVDRGTLLKSGKITFRKLEVEISYPVPYAMAIENGRAPGTMPPVAAIQEWARRKGIGNSVEQSNSIGWAIAMKIKEKGSMAQPFMQPAIEQTKREFLSR